MNNEKKTEIKVGITVLTALVLFALLYGWAKNISFGADNDYLVLEFSTVAGLEIGSMVSVNGVRKGLVESIETNNSSALVKVKFTESVDLMNDATFSVMMLDLMGGKKIEISNGISGVPLDLNKVHKGEFAGDISSAMATLYSVEGDLVDVIEELKLSLENANKLFTDSEFIGNLKKSVDNLSSLTRNLNVLISQNKDAFNSSVSNIADITEKTNSLISENQDNIGTLIKNMDSTLTASNKLINKISKFSDEVGNSENNLGKILYDENLLEDLKSSINQIKEMTGIINDQLKSGGLEVKADVDLF